MRLFPHQRTTAWGLAGLALIACAEQEASPIAQPAGETAAQTPEQAEQKKDLLAAQVVVPEKKASEQLSGTEQGTGSGQLSERSNSNKVTEEGALLVPAPPPQQRQDSAESTTEIAPLAEDKVNKKLEQQVQRGNLNIFVKNDRRQLKLHVATHVERDVEQWLRQQPGAHVKGLLAWAAGQTAVLTPAEELLQRWAAQAETNKNLNSDAFTKGIKAALSMLKKEDFTLFQYVLYKCTVDKTCFCWLPLFVDNIIPSAKSAMTCYCKVTQASKKLPLGTYALHPVQYAVLLNSWPLYKVLIGMEPTHPMMPLKIKKKGASPYPIKLCQLLWMRLQLAPEDEGLHEMQKALRGIFDQVLSGTVTFYMMEDYLQKMGRINDELVDDAVDLGWVELLKCLGYTEEEEERIFKIITARAACKSSCPHDLAARLLVQMYKAGQAVGVV